MGKNLNSRVSSVQRASTQLLCCCGTYIHQFPFSLLLSAGNVFSDTFSLICLNDTTSTDNNEVNSENIQRRKNIVSKNRTNQDNTKLKIMFSVCLTYLPFLQITDGRITTPTLSRRAPSISRFPPNYPEKRPKLPQNYPNPPKIPILSPLCEQGLCGEGLNLCF